MSEEEIIIPAARNHLTGQDWIELADAFGKNGSLRFAAESDEEFNILFARILSVAPSPP